MSLEIYISFPRPIEYEYLNSYSTSKNVLGLMEDTRIYDRKSRGIVFENKYVYAFVANGLFVKNGTLVEIRKALYDLLNKNLKLAEFSEIYSYFPKSSKSYWSREEKINFYQKQKMELPLRKLTISIEELLIKKNLIIIEERVKIKIIQDAWYGTMARGN